MCDPKLHPLHCIHASRVWMHCFIISCLLLISGVHTTPLQAQTCGASPGMCACDALTPNAVAQNLPGTGKLPWSGFEMSFITTAEYRPDWPQWTFEGNAGIVRNGQTFAAAYPNFPKGSYAVFLQNSSVLSHSSSTPAAGLWRITFHGAQRVAGGISQKQVVRVKINGATVFEEELDAGGFKVYHTRPIEHDGGTLDVEFSGTNPPGDHTALVDHFVLERVSSWDDPNTWENGVVPSNYNHIVKIPADVRVGIPPNGSVVAGDVHVEGQLLVVEGGTRFRTRTLLVSGANGLFEVGQPGSPHMEDFLIILRHGNQPERTIGGFGNKFIGACNGGSIELHGRPVTSWGYVNNAMLSPGDTTIEVSNVSGWNVGDEIVLTPTHGWGHEQIETFTITALSPGPNQTVSLTLDNPITFQRRSESRSYQRTQSPANTWDVELRARVGLLSRNLTIRANNPEDSGFGGHVMIMGAHMGMSEPGSARISNVEFYRMGQKGLLARYPIHWHMLGDAGEGQYIRNSSIHHAFNRAIVLHGSHHVEVADNLAYDHPGHGFMLEDGSEMENRIVGNLFIGSTRPAPGDEVIPSDNSHNQPQNRSPASFWITNPYNTFDNNIATATRGSGFWFALHTDPTGHSASDSRFDGIKPRELPLISFRGNEVSGAVLAFDINDSVHPTTLDVLSNLPWAPPSQQLIRDFSAWGNHMALYAGLGSQEDDVVYDNNVLIENQVHTMLATYHTIYRSLFVARSGLGNLGPNIPMAAVLLYDGAARYADSHFVGFNQPGTTLVAPFGGAVHRTNWMFEGNSYNHSGFPFINMPDYSIDNGNARNAKSIIDVDGTLGGHPGRALVTNHPYMLRGDELSAPGTFSNMHYSRMHFANLHMNYPGSASRPHLNITRRYVNGAGADRTLHSEHPTIQNHVFAVVVNDMEYQHILNHDSLPSGKRINMNLRDALAGDAVLFNLTGFGSYSPTVTGPGMQPVSSINAVHNAWTGAWFYTNGTLHLKLVSDATLYSHQTGFSVTW